MVTLDLIQSPVSEDLSSPRRELASLDLGDRTLPTTQEREGNVTTHHD